MGSAVLGVGGAVAARAPAARLAALAPCFAWCGAQPLLTPPPPPPPPPPPRGRARRRRPFERLLRKLLLMPGRPAVVLLNAYAWFKADPGEVSAWGRPSAKDGA
jgi:hypothetical protein